MAIEMHNPKDRPSLILPHLVIGAFTFKDQAFQETTSIEAYWEKHDWYFSEFRNEQP